MCEAVAPNHFEVDDEAEVTLLVEEVTEKDRALIEEAVRACPALALRLEEA
ncbi:ferredoxin [Saccharopolyspora elongata]|uniref:Ferredoxin n=2 Tax=Pseudonocardiaceae TaxID=2070 RepID=A0A4R4XUT9_9PSEU|nr:ferredoxin [Saccharopolyspora elongata]